MSEFLNLDLLWKAKRKLEENALSKPTRLQLRVSPNLKNIMTSTFDPLVFGRDYSGKWFFWGMKVIVDPKMNKNNFRIEPEGFE